MVGCDLSQLKPSELYILSFSTAKNVELLGLYPIYIHSDTIASGYGMQQVTNDNNNVAIC